MSVAQFVQTGAAALKLLSSGRSAAGTKAATTATTTTQNPNFIDLLVSQITNQNPMEPMTNQEMVTQMTQFQTLEKLDKLNENVGSMMVYQNMMNSINLLGKNVAVRDASTGELVVGKVDGIKIEGGFPGVVVKDSFYDVTQVEGIIE